MKRKYEVVISGAAGRFPESDSFDELKQNLFDQVDMVTTDNRRWTPGQVGAPAALGKLKSPNTVDMTFFGLHRKLVEHMDPHCKLSLEVSYAAIVDAGLNPHVLDGSSTAVVMGTAVSETEYECIVNIKKHSQNILAHARTMQANRISYFLNLRGPSVVLDSSWNGGYQGLQYAYDLISSGTARAALVGTAGVILNPEVSLNYQFLGRLNRDGKTKCFSDDADGYARSEGCVVYFLQRKEDALRSYGTILGIIEAAQGNKKEHLADFCQESTTRALKNVYKKSGVDPKSVTYLEGAGVASKTVDAEELNSVSEVLLGERERPLLVGCIKSNLGHSEANSSLFGLAKLIIASECGIIPPNLHYTSPNTHVPALLSGQIKVVWKPTPLEGDILAASNINVVGDMGHVIMRRHDKTKGRELKPKVLPPDGLPRLVLLTGRDQPSLETTITKIESMPLDEEFITLVNNVFKKGIRRHLFRGYTILHEGSKNYRRIEPFPGGEKKPLWFVFSGMGSQWPGMGRELMKISIFEETIRKCHEFLRPKGIDVINIITSEDPVIFDDILNSFVGIAAVQMGLVEVLRALDVEPDGMIGHSVGEMACAYADGCITIEQLILAAYSRGKASKDANLIEGMMAAVGLGYQEIKDQLPPGIEVACHNSSQSCTLSGPKQLMQEYIGELKARGVFAKLINVANIAYHSSYIRPAAPLLLNTLKQIIPEPKRRSSRWVSSSVPEADWGEEQAIFCSAEYLTNNLLGSVLFEEATSHIPAEAIILEIAPYGLLQAILKRSFREATHIPIASRADPQGIYFFLNALGRLYLEGVEMDLDQLYPKIEFPVSRGTPSLEELVSWSHPENWKSWISLKTQNEYYMNESYDLNQDQYKAFKEYRIGQKSVLPQSALLVLIINHYLKLQKILPNTTIEMDDVKFLKNVEIKDKCDLTACLLRSDCWEIHHKDDLVASGKFFQTLGKQELLAPDECDEELINGQDVYFKLAMFGHHVNRPFQLVHSYKYNDKEISASVRWEGDMITFLDSVFTLIGSIDSFEHNELRHVSDIKRIILDTSFYRRKIAGVLDVNYNRCSGVLQCEGMKLLYPTTTPLDVSLFMDKVCLFEVPTFEFYTRNGRNESELNDLIQVCVNVVLSNAPKNTSQMPKTLVVVGTLSNNRYIHKEILNIVRRMNNIELESRILGESDLLETVCLNTKDEYFFILTNEENLRWMGEKLKSFQGDGFVLVSGREVPNCAEVVLKRTVGPNSYHLCKIVNNLNIKSDMVLMSQENWETILTEKLEEAKTTQIYLIGNVTALTTIHEIVQKWDNVTNSNLLRFIFLDIDCESFDPAAHKRQFNKNLKVNILHRGEWGTSFLRPQPFAEFSDQITYTFSNIKCSGIKLQALGLNFSHDSDNMDSLQVFEYSGESADGAVCGFGLLNDMHLLPDPVLAWTKPSNWTHEQAASLTLAYSLAYYILEIDHAELDAWVLKKSSNVILVHQGTSPISQAVINVALNLGWIIFTTYKTQNEKNTIQEIFPQIPEENLFNLDNRTFDISIMTRTEGAGVKVAMNTLSEEKYLLPTMRCLGFSGNYYEISSTIMKSNAVMGMRTFLNHVMVRGVPVAKEGLLFLPEDRKRKLKELVNKGISDGIVRPPRRVTLSSDCTNLYASSVIKNSCVNNEKVVVTMKHKEEEKSANNRYICRPYKVYIIFGDSKGFWVDLCKWLIRRGARKISVVFEKISSSTFHKFTSLVNKYKSAKVALHSKRRLNIWQSTDALLPDIAKGAEIGALFVIGKEYKEEVQCLSEAANRSHLVCLGVEGGELLCEERASLHLPSLAISAPHHLLINILPSLDAILLAPHPVLYISENDYQAKEEQTDQSGNYVDHLPKNRAELMGLRREGEGGWKELRTRSLPWKHTREVPPVFVLPSLTLRHSEGIVSRLFHPVFQALLPPTTEDIESLARHLKQKLMEDGLKCGIYNLLCVDWSWRLGLELGRLLESDGHQVCLIILAGSTNWIRSISFKALLLKYQSETSDDGVTPGELLQPLEILYHRIRLVTETEPTPGWKFNGKCHLITTSGNKHMKETVQKALKKAHSVTKAWQKFYKLVFIDHKPEPSPFYYIFCSNSISIEVSKNSDLLTMLKSSETSELINSKVAVTQKKSPKCSEESNRFLTMTTETEKFNVNCLM